MLRFPKVLLLLLLLLFSPTSPFPSTFSTSSLRARPSSTLPDVAPPPTQTRPPPPFGAGTLVPYYPPPLPKSSSITLPLPPASSRKRRPPSAILPDLSAPVTGSQLMELLSTHYSRTSPSQAKASAGGVAFPQPVPLTSNTLTLSTSFTTGLLSLILFQTISPNLWLLGYLSGSLYGHHVATASLSSSTTSIATSPPSRVLLSLGSALARRFVQAREILNSLWFTYRTGQLSYAYWKQYEKIDSRFQVQQKMDAWNSKFQEGKKNFDKWERENEVGRKVLAGLRTVWMVDGRRTKGLKGGSRSRLARAGASTAGWLGRFFAAVLDPFRGNGVEELRDLAVGVAVEIESLDYEIATRRAVSGAAALVLVSFGGRVLVAWPRAFGLLACGVGGVYPGFMATGWRRLKGTFEEVKAAGREGGVVEGGEAKAKEKGNAEKERLLRAKEKLAKAKAREKEKMKRTKLKETEKRKASPSAKQRWPWEPPQKPARKNPWWKVL